MTDKKRDTYVDTLRGVAMLLVVLGHTLTEAVEHSQNSILFNIIWSLQIPLFILVSGYVTRYGRKPETISETMKLLVRRTVAYILPWIIFTVVINGIILKKQEVTPRALFWNMDYGYWFLITIWCINIAFILSRFIAGKMCKKQSVLTYITLIFYGCFVGLYALIGYFAGMSFFCIKLTLYYMPFYFLGYLFGVYKDTIFSRFFTGIQIIIAACTVVWVVAIVKLHLFYLDDTFPTIIIRAGVSLSGCIAVCGLFKAFSASGIIYRFTGWIGARTIEIYLLHNFFLNMIVLSAKPEYSSALGFAVVAVNYVVTVLTVSVIAKLLSCNRYLSFILFGKTLKKN